MNGNFGLHVLPTGISQSECFKIDYNTGKTWRYLLGCWVLVKEA